jgi:hypothetical protein
MGMSMNEEIGLITVYHSGGGAQWKGVKAVVEENFATGVL